MKYPEITQLWSGEPVDFSFRPAAYISPEELTKDPREAVLARERQGVNVEALSECHEERAFREVEIATVCPIDWVSEPIWVLARYSRKSWTYRVMCEAHDKFDISPEESAEPLTFGELIDLIDGAVDHNFDRYRNPYDKCRGLVLPFRDMNMLSSAPIGSMGDPSVTSPFYPQLEGYYRAVGGVWYRTRREQMIAKGKWDPVEQEVEEDEEYEDDEE